ncbi:CDP-glycerol glycerophosphotransferase family protein [Niallia sp. MER 6]|uniref:CDP-glycerol glycerophosphotransferase family protein n=1 Tax=Niallia sp. MER 6 TaxID=2939567 RepID=UPI00203FC713|nr:CDP-glycerol glycerophosphotransferase family protein [Niallia sp. MER 6]MCM3029707.1 CDP-glycerol glycerophosphotransferase family protein [Niallia sp. MER 6]
MVREFAISLYLTLFSLLFRISSLFPQQKKIVFCVSFPENSMHIYEELKKTADDKRCIFLAATAQTKEMLEEKQIGQVLEFTPRKPKAFLAGIRHLATAKVVILDNYFGFLSSITFKPNVKVLQIWHAAGAIKTFGLKDSSIQNRTSKANQRFKDVYSQFQYVITGSHEMDHIFHEAFSIQERQIMHTGIPRTDIFFDETRKKETITKIYSEYPQFENKRILLYAPTFRGENNGITNSNLDIKQLKNRLGEDTVILIRLHPSIKEKAHLPEMDAAVYDVSEYPYINELLLITDLLITDYSSIPFEYSFLRRPMIFFPYDLEEYAKDRGFWTDYNKLVPGPVAYTTAELADILTKNEYDLNRIDTFHKRWNEYSTGQSSEKVAALIIEWLND